MIGKVICDLAPCEFNNRNSEGAFITLKNGSLLFAYTRYRGGGFYDECVADIYGTVSDDDGETFGNPFLLFSAEDVGADNIMSVSLMRLKSGDIGLFYLQKHNDVHSCIPYFVTLSDDGKIRDRHIRCIKEDGYYVLNNDRVIVLDNGRILMPVSKHAYKDDVFLPGSIFVYASDDDGESWYKISDEIKINPFDGRRKNFTALHNCMEPGLVQLENGSVWCYIRTELGRQYETFSDDFGATWNIPQPSPFTSAVSPMCVKKLKSGRLFAVWNPVPLCNGKSDWIDGAWTAARTPLVFTILDGDGGFNAEYRKIEFDEKSGFCYCAIHETEKGDILLGYCAGGGKDKSCLNRLRIRKIYKNEIYSESSL